MSEPTNEEVIEFLRTLIKSGKFDIPAGDVLDLADRLEAETAARVEAERRLAEATQAIETLVVAKECKALQGDTEAYRMLKNSGWDQARAFLALVQPTTEATK